MIWAIFAFMTAVAMAVLVVPLTRLRPKAAARSDYDMVVYKDQLGEIDRDLERGVLTADQAGAARVEIQRRLLAAAESAKETAVAPRRVPMLAGAVVVALPVIAFGLYAVLGSPFLPDRPHAGRQDPAQDMQQQAEMFQGMVAQLEAKLAQNPDDGKGWAMMGRSLRVLGQPDKAREAYLKAIRLLPGDAAVRLEYAAVLLDAVPQGAALPADFVALMREVQAVQPDQPDALYFLGIAEMQAGNTAKAKALWTRLVKLLPEESEDRAEIQRLLDGQK